MILNARLRSLKDCVRLALQLALLRIVTRADDIRHS